MSRCYPVRLAIRGRQALVIGGGRVPAPTMLTSPREAVRSDGSHEQG
jgi:hypothetical protein